MPFSEPKLIAAPIIDAIDRFDKSSSEISDKMIGFLY